MAVPKKKTTKSTKGQRRSHHALKKATINACPNCKKPILPHHACKNCGSYKGKKVLDIKVVEDKKTKKMREKEEKKQAKEAQKDNMIVENDAAKKVQV